jgi:hypothetical protein
MACWFAAKLSQLGQYHQLRLLIFLFSEASFLIFQKDSGCCCFVAPLCALSSPSKLRAAAPAYPRGFVPRHVVIPAAVLGFRSLRVAQTARWDGHFPVLGRHESIYYNV